MTIETLIKELKNGWEQQRKQSESDETYFRGASEAASVILSYIEKANEAASSEQSGVASDSES